MYCIHDCVLELVVCRVRFARVSCPRLRFGTLYPCFPTPHTPLARSISFTTHQQQQRSAAHDSPQSIHSHFRVFTDLRPPDLCTVTFSQATLQFVAYPRPSSRLLGS